MRIPRPLALALVAIAFAAGPLAAQTVTASPAAQPLPDRAPHPAAQPAHTPGGEVNLQLPDLEQGELPRPQRASDPAVRPRGVRSWACCSASGPTRA